MTPSIREEVAVLVSGESLLAQGSPTGWPEDVPPPEVHLAPGSEEEVSAVLERASREGWTVLPAGAGSWLGGGGTPEADILLSTRRMGGISFYEPADLTFTACAGTDFKELQETVGQHGQWVPLDPPGWDTGTLGGLVATGRAGPLRYAFGSPRDHVLGLTMVAGDGRVLRWGGRVVKNVAGFDVTRLLIGSFGALGVLTSVSARLFPLPEVDRTLLILGPTMEDLLPVSRALANSPLPLSSVELMDPLGPVGRGNGGGAALVVRLMGTRPQVAEMESRVRRLSGGGCRLETPDPEAGRSVQEGLASWERGAELVVRLALLPSEVDSLVGRGRSLTQEVCHVGGGGSRLALHVGWGILRVAFHGLSARGKEEESVCRILTRVREEMEKEGGSLVLSDGPTGLLRTMGPWGGMGGEANLMAGLKKEFDPSGILVPYRFGV